MKRLEHKISHLVMDYQGKTGTSLTIGTVESATGGRIADKITNVPGSSVYYKGTIVAYSNDVKSAVVGVKEETLDLHGAVSREAALEMARGGLKLLKVDVCLSTTGIAGPSGATPVKPPGLFYIGLAAGNSTYSHKFIFSGNRETIKRKATDSALEILKEYLQKKYDAACAIPLEEKHVVTCFLEHRHHILILRRSGKVGTYRRAWAGVSGYVETTPLDQAYTEIREETGLFKSTVKLIRQGEPVEVIDKSLNRKWVVHPFLFHVTEIDRLKTDWEHTEFKWIKPEELKKYKTVPGLARALDRVLD